MQLTLIETEEAYLVVFDKNPDDWVVRFSKSNSFPAREWAERMAKLYNLREPGVKEPEINKFPITHLGGGDSHLRLDFNS